LEKNDLKKILFVSQKNLLHDIRLEAKLNSLVSPETKVSVLLLYTKDIKSHFVIKKLNKYVSVKRNPFWKKIYKFPKNVIKSFYQYIILVKNHDLIWVDNPPDTPIILFFFLAKLMNKKIIFDLNDPMYLAAISIFDEKGTIRSKWYRRLELISYYFVNRCDRVSATSKEMKQYLINNGVNPNKIEVFPNKADLEIYNISSEKVKRFKKEMGLEKNIKILTWVGIIQKLRGLDILIESIKKVKKIRNDFKLFIVGMQDNIVCENLKNMIKEYELSDCIIPVDYVDNTIIPLYFHIADIGVLPRKNTLLTCSGMPNKFFAYLALGKCLIFPDLEPAFEYFKNNNFIMFKADNIDDLADRIIYALDNYKKIQKNIERKEFIWDPNKFANFVLKPIS